MRSSGCNVAVACLVFGLLALPASGAEETPGASWRLRLLPLVHDGRFDDADALLRSTSPGPGEASAHAFFQAFVTYWRLIYDDENEALRSDFEEQLRRAIETAKEDLEGDSPDHETALWKGSSHLLYAQLKAARRKAFSAAFEAKRSYRALQLAVRTSPADEADADFGLGTYQYYVDQLPAIVKGLRFLLFIPGGNRDEGLRRLRRAADESRYFSLESRLILATIYASEHEQMFDEAIEIADETVASNPETLAVLHGAARLDLELYRPWIARERLTRALERATKQDGTDDAVLAALRFHAARAEASLFRPDLALRHLEPLLREQDRYPVNNIREVRLLAARIALLCPDPPEWYGTVLRDGPKSVVPDPEERRRMRAAGRSLQALRPALDAVYNGQTAEAIEIAEKGVRKNPDDPVYRLVAGRLLVRESDRAAEALRLLESAVSDPNLPDGMRRSARLLAGQAADLLGKREVALDWYRKTEEGPSFPGRDAAVLYQRRPYGAPASR